jgi:putative tryptophan/tyrosine transport system substrate-binding protein
MPVIGFLGGADPVGYAPQIGALRLGLRDRGYIEGQTIAIEFRWAQGRYDRLKPTLPDRGADHVEIETCCSTLIGILKKNVEPCPTVDSTQSLPPCISIMRFEIASPNPVPPFMRVIELSAC